MPANIDVEHNGDCGFESIAATLIDMHRNKKLTSTHAVGNLAGFIRAYQREFPFDLLDIEESQEAFSQLIANFQPKELIRRVAFALRQYAVDIIVAEPQKYPGAFVDNPEGTNPQSMRKPGVWIDGSALAAISSGIKIPLVVVGDSFQARLSTQPSVCKDPINLYLSGSHYQPYVEDVSYFNSTTSQTSYKGSTQRVEVSRTDPPLSEIWAKIRQSEQLDEERKDQIKIDLASLYNTEDLIAIYRQAMLNSDYLPNKIVRVTAENNGNTFLQDAIAHKKADKENDAKLNEVLVHALAIQAYIDPTFDHVKLHQNSKAIVTNLMDEQSIFSRSIKNL